MGDVLWTVDWEGLLRPERSLLEMILRGTIMYFVVVGLLRSAVKRQLGMTASTDVLVIVLLAEIAGPGFTANYASVVEGAVLVATVLFWSHVVEWLVYRFAEASRALDATPVMLIKDGRMLKDNMRAELVSRVELMAQLRKEGIDDISEVHEACMEADGMISIIKRSADQAG